jgi:hypothetical protein
MVRPGSRLLRVRVESQTGAPLRVWAVRQPGRRLSVLFIDRTARAVRVDLVLSSRFRATVQRLLAPSPRATSGETLDGQRLGPDLRWHGRRQIETAAPHDGSFAVTVRPMSASVVTVPLVGPRSRRPARRRF